MQERGGIPECIYHLALRDEWEASLRRNRPYERSTLGRSLAEEGFVHCSLPGQVQAVADLVYRGRSDVVLLTIEVSRVGADIRLESPAGTDERYPHIHGAIPLEAVLSAVAVPLGRDGRLAVASVLPAEPDAASDRDSAE